MFALAILTFVLTKVKRTTSSWTFALCTLGTVALNLQNNFAWLRGTNFLLYLRRAATSYSYMKNEHVPTEFFPAWCSFDEMINGTNENLFLYPLIWFIFLPLSIRWCRCQEHFLYPRNFLSKVNHYRDFTPNGVKDAVGAEEARESSILQNVLHPLLCLPFQFCIP